MNNLRKKIVSAAVAASLLGGSLVAFAGTNAGDQLKAWYNAQFKNSTNNIVSVLTNYFNTTYKKPLLKWFGELKDNSVKDIKDHASTTLTNSTKAINDYANTYTTQITEAKESILDNMADDYLAFENTKKDWGKEQMDAEQEKRQGEINTAVTSEFTTQKDSLERDLNNTKTSAVNSLEKTIKDAKDAIKDAINTNESNTINNLKAFLDSEITNRKSKMEKDSSDFVDTKKDEITDAANKIVNAAKAELDALVNGINK